MSGLSGPFRKPKGQAWQGAPASGLALLEALPLYLWGEVEDLEALKEAARPAPAGLSGNLPALALWGFLNLPEKGEA